MSKYSGVAAVSNAVKEILELGLPKDELGDINFQLCHPADFETLKPDTVSIWLFRIVVNGSMRNIRKTNKNNQDIGRVLPLDLYYLLTPWIKDVERQQSCLVWSMRTLEDNAHINASILNAKSPDPAFDETESVELVCDPLPLSDFLTMTQHFHAKFPTSMVISARTVTVESHVPPLSTPTRIIERKFKLGEMSDE